MKCKERKKAELTSSQQARRRQSRRNTELVARLDQASLD